MSSDRAAEAALFSVLVLRGVNRLYFLVAKFGYKKKSAYLCNVKRNNNN